MSHRIGTIYGISPLTYGSSPPKEYKRYMMYQKVNSHPREQGTQGSEHQYLKRAIHLQSAEQVPVCVSAREFEACGHQTRRRLSQDQQLRPPSRQHVFKFLQLKLYRLLQQLLDIQLTLPRDTPALSSCSLIRAGVEGSNQAENKVHHTDWTLSWSFFHCVLWGTKKTTGKWMHSGLNRS